MSATECPHFGRPLDFPTECTICSGADAKLKAEQADADAPSFIVARYQAFCPECDQVIYPGHVIAWFPMHNRPAVHHDCFQP